MGRGHIKNPRLQLLVGDVRKVHKVFPVFWQWGAGWRTNWAGALWRRWRSLRSDWDDIMLGLRQQVHFILEIYGYHKFHG